MAKVLLAYLSEARYSNLEHGMARGIWGLPSSVQGFPPEFYYLLISSQIKPGGPRRPPSEWPDKTLTITVAKRTGNLAVAHTFLWPDEHADKKIYYRIRFPVKRLVTRIGVRAGDELTLPRSASIAIRDQAISGGAPVIRIADTAIQDLIQKGLKGDGLVGG